MSGVKERTPATPTPLIPLPTNGAPAQHAANGHSANGVGKHTSKPAANGATKRRQPSQVKQAQGQDNPAAQAAARATVLRLRDEASAWARPLVGPGAAPIRVMARMVADLEAKCRDQGLPESIVRAEVVNRTIGDVDLRRVSPEEDGSEYISLADDMGVALPGEVIGGRRSTGETYRWLHARMLDFERALLARHFDLRMYDLAGVGNPILRETLAQHAHDLWGQTFTPEQIYLSIGSLDGIGKTLQGYTSLLRTQGEEQFAILCPSPGFNVPEWQAETLGWRLHHVRTRAEACFKLTPDDLTTALAEAPDLRAIYLTVSNNPTAFAYSADELRALFDVLRASDRKPLVIADLAYIGTANPDHDRARMVPFFENGALEQTVFCCSYSKSHTLTGDRCGWVAFGDPTLATALGPGWTNTTAALPAEWQLRYMAYVQLFAERPELEQRIRKLYHLRRERLNRQLRRLNAREPIFAQINLDDGGTVYNWSQLLPGEDVFSLFGKTGIAGVPGGAFGYSDDYVRLSIGCIPVPEAPSV
jgi:aspartate/methionine/tyrosine aminotransferase